MNQTLKDKAWKVFEIAFYVALASFVLIRWKSFLDWLVWYVADLVKGIIFLMLIAVLFFLVRAMVKSDE